MTRVLVGAASPVVRAGLEAILASGSGLEVLHSRGSPIPLPQQVEILHPDVVLVELERGVESPAPVLLSLGGMTSSIPVVLLTEHMDGESIVEALRLGARAVLPREAAGEEIVAAVEAAAAGLMVIQHDDLQSVLALLSVPARAVAAETEALTPREIEVLHMLAEGEGNKMIARRLKISEHTVKFHVGSILAKLGASSRTEAVTIGVRQGIILL